MTLPPTLTPQRSSAYIIVYLIPRTVLKISPDRCSVVNGEEIPAAPGAISPKASKHYDNLWLRAYDIMQAVYILYIRTGIQLSSVRPTSHSTRSSCRLVLGAPCRGVPNHVSLSGLPRSDPHLPSLSCVSFCVTKTVTDFQGPAGTA